VLSTLRRGAGDPAHRFLSDGSVWRATRTPDGPALLLLRSRPSVGEVKAQAWGPGAGWVVDGVPELLGARDDDSGFEPRTEHRLLVEARRAAPAWRVPRSRAVLEALVCAALEAVVTGKESRASYRWLLRRHGEPAPGPAQDPTSPAAGMRVMPTPEVLRAVPSWEWLRAGVEERRRRVVVAAAQVAPALERTVGLGDMAAVERVLRSLPGVGVWTAAEVRQRAHGDADAFSFADFHVAKDVTWALTGRVQDDAACAALLEPYRGHRYRVQRLLEMHGVRRPRLAPRMTLPTHLPSQLQVHTRGRQGA